MRIFANLLRASAFSSVKEPSGSVYIWGDKNTTKLNVPENIKRVSLGQNHSAVVGESGNLYTFGENQYGQLGHGDKEKQEAPKLVEFFDRKNIKVKEALCGSKHTIVLTEDGNVYTFGYGGKRPFEYLNIFGSKPSALGHGSQESIHKPKLVKYFEHMNVERITAGNRFNFAIDNLGKIYFWGCGEYGVIGNGGTTNCSVPTTNEYFQYLEEEEKITIKKVKSCGDFTISLMTNGYLYGWGSNSAGQIGIKNEIGIEMHEMVNYPHAMIREGFDNKLVKNFDVSENLTIFQLQDNELWWCGRNIAYKPERIVFHQEQETKLFAAGFKTFAIVTKDNSIHQMGKFFNADGEEDITTGLKKLDGNKIFDGREILGMGGEYNTRYAIVN